MFQIEIKHYLRNSNQINIMVDLLKPLGMSIERLYPKDKVVNILYSLLQTIKIDFMATEMYHISNHAFLSRCRNNVLVIMNCLMAIGVPKPVVILYITENLPALIWPNLTC